MENGWYSSSSLLIDNINLWSLVYKLQEKLVEEFIFVNDGILTGGRRHSQSFYRIPVSVNV